MKNVLLLSGGLDSTVLLAHRLNHGDEITAISFDYGQTHRGQELAAAKKIAAHYGVPHRIVGLCSAFLPSALTGQKEIPEQHAEQPDATLVPARNMVLLSIGVAIAEAEAAEGVLFGANKDDHAGYPDCRPPFIEAISRAAALGTQNHVSVLAPFAVLNKKTIVDLGRHLDVPIELSWSCYRGGETPCDRCGACQSRKEAGA